MSDSTPENRTSSGSTEEPDDQLISDDQLPEDLQPAKNPMARDADDDSAGSAESDDATKAAEGGPSVQGMPDVGQPG